MSLQLRIGAASDAGRRRTENEDSFLVDFDPGDYPERPALFVVCDGVGGAVAGKTASRLAAERVGRTFRERTDGDLSARLVEAAERASAQIFEHALSHPATEGMATTLVAAALDGARCHVVNVGDSRAYRTSEGDLLRLTIDHTLVQEQMASGLITAEQAAESPYRHIITRSLGGEPGDIGVASYPSLPLADGQRFILCSDGLTDMVSESEILTVAAAQEPEQAAHLLVELANEHGGRDNITVIVIGVRESER